MYFFIMTAGDNRGHHCETKIIDTFELIEEFRDKVYRYGGPQIRPVKLGEWREGTLKNLKVEEFEEIFSDFIPVMGALLYYYPNIPYGEKYPFFRREVYLKYGQPMNLRGRGTESVAEPI